MEMITYGSIIEVVSIAHINGSDPLYVGISWIIPPATINCGVNVHET